MIDRQEIIDDVDKMMEEMKEIARKDGIEFNSKVSQDLLEEGRLSLIEHIYEHLVQQEKEEEEMEIISNYIFEVRDFYAARKKLGS